MAVDWNAPQVLVEQYAYFAKLQHAICGIYVWELANNIHFDWTLLTPKRPESVSSVYARLVYLACRYLTLIALFTIVVGCTAKSRFEIDCKVWMICTLALSFSAVTLASTLIAIRAIAIWNRSRIVIGLVILVLATQLASFVHGVSQADAAWSPVSANCIFLNTQTNQLNVTTTFVTDIFLLLTVLFGLLRWRDARRRHGLWDILWRQGLVWLALAAFAEVPTVVFVWLNLNQVMNVMFFTPELVILVIGATRMYRALWAHDTTAYDLSILSTADRTPETHTDVRLKKTRFSPVTLCDSVSQHETEESQM